MASFVLTVVASWGIYALLGMGIVLVYRTSRVLNIAGGELAIFIGYRWRHRDRERLPFPVAVSLGMACAVALGFAIFWFAIRRVMGEPPFVGLMLTVGIGTIFNGFMIIVFGGGMVAYSSRVPASPRSAPCGCPCRTSSPRSGLGSRSRLIAHLPSHQSGPADARGGRTRDAQRSAGLNVDRTVATSWIIGPSRSDWPGILHGESALRCPVRLRHRHQRAHRMPDRRNGQPRRASSSRP